MPKALITGITGQDGSYLAELLLDKGYDVVGMQRPSSAVNFERIEHIENDIVLAEGDLSDGDSMVKVLREHEPDEIYNLAAQSFVQTSFGQPVLAGDVNALGVTRLLDAIRMVAPEARFFQASTSEMFGQATQVPQTESTPFHPRSPYGVAKLYGHWITINYRQSYQMHTSSGILFNHESPRRGAQFVTRKVTMAAAHIKAGMQDELFLGNLDSQRDWGHARDYVDAMWRMLQQETPGEYVISTGETHTIRRLCEVAFGVVGLDWEQYVKVNPEFYRPVEVDLLVGDSTKAKQDLDWEPTVSFEDLITEMVEADVAALE